MSAAPGSAVHVLPDRAAEHRGDDRKGRDWRGKSLDEGWWRGAFAQVAAPNASEVYVVDVGRIALVDGRVPASYGASTPAFAGGGGDVGSGA